MAIPYGQRAVENSNILRINDTTKFLWDILQNDTSYEELLKQMKEKYQASEEELPILKQDLDEFLAKARKLQLLEE